MNRYHVTLSEVWKVVIDVHAENEAHAVRKARHGDKRDLVRVYSHLLASVEVEEEEEEKGASSRYVTAKKRDADAHVAD